MNLFDKAISKLDSSYSKCLRRDKLSTLQINVGDLCNQACRHCHVGASPDGKNVMRREVFDDIISFLCKNKIETVDITGGAPEMNPSLKYFIEKATALADKIILRTNLTILLETGYEDYLSFYKSMNVELVCSLPCYIEENVDRQRGNHVYEKSIEALIRLNAIGYGVDKNLPLRLVYNPAGPFLPPNQEELEIDYRNHLRREYGVEFTDLITITNVPIKRFADDLKSENKFDDYLDTLYDNFNPQVLENIMCRTFLSVAYDGTLYDCDFNQALRLNLCEEDGKKLNIKDLDSSALENRKIITAQHCLACTAGAGSSCKGTLT